MVQAIKRPKPLTENTRMLVMTASDPLGTKQLNIIKQGIDFFHKQGYKVIAGDTLTEEHDYNNWLDLRKKELNRADYDAIFFAWGGEIANDLLPYIPYERYKRTCPLIMGFSDTTVIQNAILQKSGLISYYGHFVGDFSSTYEHADEYAIRSLDVLRSDKPTLSIPARLPRKLIKTGPSAIGTLVGGCITDFRKLLGIPYLPLFDKIILLIESYTITLPEFKATLTSIMQSPLADRVTGVILGRIMGDFSDEDLTNAILHTLRDFDIPVIKTLDFGHLQPNWIFPLGATCKLHGTEITVTF